MKTAGFWFGFVLGFLFFVVVTVNFFYFPKVWSLWLSIHEHLLSELCISRCWVQKRDSRASWYDQHPLLSLFICHSVGLDQSQNFLLILTKSGCVSNRETGGGSFQNLQTLCLNKALWQMQIFNWILNFCFSEHSGTWLCSPDFRRMKECTAGHAELLGSWSWQIVFQGEVELVGRKASGRNISGIAIHTWRITGVCGGVFCCFFLVLVLWFFCAFVFIFVFWGFLKWILLNTRGVSALALTKSWLRIFLSSSAVMICSTGLVISKDFVFFWLLCFATNVPCLLNSTVN